MDLSPNHAERIKPKFYYGWVIVGVSFLSLVVAFGVRLSFAVFFVDLIEEFGWSRGDTALIFSLSMVVFAIASTPSGYALDRWGARRTFGAGAILLAAGLALSSRVHTLWQLILAYGVIAGTGITILGLGPQASLIARWFRKRRGTAIGIAFAGTGLGTLTFTPGVERLIASFGWRTAYLVLSVLALATLPAILLLLRLNPEDKGLEIDGGPPNRSVVDPGFSERDWPIQAVLQHPAFWALIIAGLGAIGPLRMLTVHQIAALVDAGFNKLQAASIVGLAGAITAGAFLLFGMLSDRIGRRHSYVLGSVCLLLAMVILALVKSGDSPLWLYLYAVFLGLGEGSRSSLVTAIASDLFPGNAMGTINGAIGAAFGAGAAFFPWLAGRLHDSTGNYTIALELAAAGVILSTIALWLAPVMNAQVKSLARYPK